MLNKLGDYIFKRICKDQEQLRKSQPMNTYGLYVRSSDIQRYINDYTNYGIDFTGNDNESAEDRLEHHLEGFFESKIDKYWDDGDQDL
tara:strand:+ start:510 stop:773 length:264 start_codon:yes stop_codon:yes gene_type:complete